MPAAPVHVLRRFYNAIRKAISHLRTASFGSAPIRLVTFRMLLRTIKSQMVSMIAPVSSSTALNLEITYIKNHNANDGQQPKKSYDKPLRCSQSEVLYKREKALIGEK